MASKDLENPDWTVKDFDRATGPEGLPEHVLAGFPATQARLRGAQKAPRKVPISIRLDLEIVEHFKALGAGWQGRINDVLAESIKR
jgi:uncharacterized protein (DUF4415 family)